MSIDDLLQAADDDRARKQGLARRACSPEEAGDIIGISRCSVYKLLKTGELRSLSVGRRRVIPVDAIEELLNGSAA